MGQIISDGIIVLALAVFAVRGACTGLVGEAASLLSLVGGFWVASHFYSVLAQHLTFITAWRDLASYVLLFLAVFIAVGLLQKLLPFSCTGWIDKVAGGLLGLARGVLIMAVILLILQTIFGNAGFLRHSRVLPCFAPIMVQVHDWDWLPPGFPG
ncbi:CvpA family protein [Desulfovibrio sp. SGI.133]|uniref:CvpA family protein n=1 Tax=Desulfovibrio sp. SGI.133 TaxID=3420560 RepID=UPI003D06C3FD